MATSSEGKVALVTGGSSGLGRATALAFAREGAKVVIADVKVDGGNETVRMVEDLGGEAIFVKADVSKAAEVQALIDTAVQTYGRLDYAHNNAGIEGATALTHEYPEDSWDRVIDINLKGVWLCMKYEIPQMLQQGGGAIVNTSSVAGLVAESGVCAYVASKHGIAGLTKTAAIEYARPGIRINAVCPGIIDTPMLDDMKARDPEGASKHIELHPIGRAADPREIAETVIWLCSEAASFAIGHTMVVDGGYGAQ